VLYGHSYALALGSGHHDPISDFTRLHLPFGLGLPGIGVSLFFALSGFLVAGSFERRSDLFEFLEARALRLYPALAVAVVFCAVLGVFFSKLPMVDYFSHPATRAYLVDNMSLYQARFRLPGEVFGENPFSGGVNGSLWTLPIELRMYLWVALLGILSIIAHRSAFNLFFLGVLGIYAAGGNVYPFDAMQEIRLGIFFLFGALAWVNRERIGLSPWLFGLGVLLCVVSKGSRLYPVVFAGVFTYGILMLAYSSRIRLPRLQQIGDLSYGVYLYAFPVQQTIVATVHGITPIAVLIATTSIVLPMAALSWHLVERRSLSWKGRSARWLAQNAWPWARKTRDLQASSKRQRTNAPRSDFRN
jgi:peptidoglycan/LPS O-acetylase OafA/YrhL